MSLPTAATVKRLFALSANQCAFPKCSSSLVDKESGKVTGRICHIKARQAGGPRYDPNQTDKERSAFENLLLLCSPHHDVIDSDPESYTVERLLKIKTNHEGLNQRGEEPSDEVATVMIGASYNQVTDGSLLLSQNQTGGQTANQITNFSLQPDLAASLEREIQIKRDAHDLDIFRRSDLIFHEDQLDQLYSLLIGNHSYRNSLYIAMSNFIDFLSKTQNQFLNGRLESSSSEIVSSFRKLREFLIFRFFDFPDNQPANADIQFCLQPDLCIDRAHST
ncbi:MAG: hypothetical protein QOE33_2741, partial [Acidobacteriota bacterium]|nr:hypothetical protein [Acidobacteriota bacterium]